MYSFEGQFRRRPTQSLGGMSKKEEKDVLLQRTQEERNKREDQRRQMASAITIQAFYRGCMMRKRVKHIERQKFDELCMSKFVNVTSEKTWEESLPYLWRQLHFFYNTSADKERLIWFCQLCIRHRPAVLKYLSRNISIGLHNIKRTLWMCCRQISSMDSSNASSAVPLRMLEIFTSSLSYTSSDNLDGNMIVPRILSYIVNKGFYKCMRLLIEEKIPPSMVLGETMPTPMSTCILELIWRPIILVTNTDNITQRNETLQSMCEELFCEPHVDQIVHFLLPALKYSTDVFPFSELLQALVQKPSRSSTYTDTYDDQLTVQGSLLMLFMILTLGGKYIDCLSKHDMRLYLTVLHQLVPYLQPSTSGLNNRQVGDSDSEEEMDISPTANGEIHQKCIDLIDHQQHVGCLLTFTRNHAEPSEIQALCAVCYVLISYCKCAIHKTRLLYSLAFSPWFLRRLWQICNLVSTSTVTGSRMGLLQVLSGGLSITSHHLNTIAPLLYVFSSLFSHSLFSLHDSEFYGQQKDSSQMPFRLDELIPMCQSLRDACLGIIELSHPESVKSFHRVAAFYNRGGNQKNVSGLDHLRQMEIFANVFKVTSQLVKQLYDRDSRRPFCPTGDWLAKRVNIMAEKPSQIFHVEGDVFQRRAFGSRSLLNPRRKMEEDLPKLSNTDVRNITVLTELPFVVYFQERVKILQKLLNLDHIQHQRDASHFSIGPMINISIRRNYIYEDAFDRLSVENEPNLKLRVQVQLRNFEGLDEAGIDGGGIFREFMSELLKTAYDPNRGFFKYTSDKLLYPSPQANLLAADYARHYHFLGRILGKALYENMLLELPLASFFLNKILSRRGGNVDIHHLASLDPEMYKNLLFLKNYEGDVADLGLDFTVVNNDLGEAQVEELKNGGRDIPVTIHNRIEYIHLMADYRLNKQIQVHCQSFRQGLADVINIDWLRMFDANELQILISGASVPVNIDDLRRHTNYSGGYHENHLCILTFWHVVENFTDEQKRFLLKFVTSCSRPPLLGFKDLYPAFCIQNGGTDDDRLPSASTCMNLLKLPEFSSSELMKQKLIYAIESNSGFELS